MQPLGGSEELQQPTVHALQLSRLVGGRGGKVLVRCRVTYSKAQDIALEVGVQAEQRAVVDLVILAIGG